MGGAKTGHNSEKAVGDRISNRRMLTAAELGEQEFNDFFRDSSASWRPYAAGLPWIRELDLRPGLLNYMKHLDADGPEENKILYLVSEPGAGGTTLARAMAFGCAREGYPVVMAKPLPFALDPLPVSNFLTRIHARLERPRLEAQAPSPAGPAETDSATRRYETPWLIVFDTVHSQYREAELVQFRNEMEKAGRPVCLLVVTGPQVGAPLVNKRMSVQLAELNHVIQLEDARALGVHLNKFLTWYGRSRPESQWDNFYQEHTVRYLQGLAAFWAALSFWIQGQFDLAESMQEWIYKVFLRQTETDLRLALLRIAAFSTERLPLPERLLPATVEGWPLPFRLAEARQSLAALGLTALSSDGEKYWAIIHDILGRLLINGPYYDAKTRTELGFAAASDPNHLRFLILRDISQDGALGEKPYKPLGEDFATTIFKVDPDHGHAGLSTSGSPYCKRSTPCPRRVDCSATTPPFRDDGLRS